MQAVQFSVVVLPKLDNEDAIQQLREKYDPWFHRIRPYITMVAPFTPATLDEIQHVGDYISRARRNLHPVAVSLHRCEQNEDRFFFLLDDGKEELLELQRSLHGSEGPMLIREAGPEPRLVIGRVPDPSERAEALAAANRIGRTVGIVDSVVLIRTEADGELKMTASYPFGIGRVDYFDRSGV